MARESHEVMGKDLVEIEDLLLRTRRRIGMVLRVKPSP